MQASSQTRLDGHLPTLSSSADPQKLASAVYCFRNTAGGSIEPLRRAGAAGRQRRNIPYSLAAPPTRGRLVIELYATSSSLASMEQCWCAEPGDKLFRADLFLKRTMRHYVFIYSTYVNIRYIFLFKHVNSVPLSSSCPLLIRYALMDTAHVSAAGARQVQCDHHSLFFPFLLPFCMYLLKSTKHSLRRWLARLPWPLAGRNISPNVNPFRLWRSF